MANQPSARLAQRPMASSVGEYQEPSQTYADESGGMYYPEGNAGPEGYAGGCAPRCRPGLGRFDGGYGGCCGLFDPANCALNGHLWFRGEYLLWWTKAMNAPALVTSGPTTAAVGIAGVIGRTGTSVEFGDEGIGGLPHSGGRLQFGWWLDPMQNTGIEASFLGLGSRTTRYRAASTDSPVLARPYFDLQADAEAAMLVSYPGLLSGSIAADASTEMQSIEVLWRNCLIGRPDRHVDALIGYRFARLNEGLRIDQTSSWLVPQGLIVANTTKSLFDQFDTTNQFHGVELGFACEDRFDRWTFDLLLKLGLGNTSSKVTIDGQTQTTVPGAGTATFTGGLLAQTTNIGSYTKNQFAVIPELELTLGYDLTPRLRATMGYNFLYWSRVARPGDQIDRDASQLPPEAVTGAQRPAFQFSGSDFWAQGLRFGLDFHF